MKSNLRITAAARFISLFLTLCLLVTACGSAGTGDSSVGANTQDSSTENDGDVTVESGDTNHVGSSEMTDDTEQGTGTEPDTEPESGTEETPVEPELSPLEKLWQNRLVCNTSGKLNIRAEATTESDIVGKMEKGNYGEILEVGAEWTKIKSGNAEGWVFNEYCAFGMDAYEIAQKMCVTWAVSTVDNLRVRAGAGTNKRVVSKLNTGEKLQVKVGAETVEGWIPVLYMGDVCYVSAEFVTTELKLTTAMTAEEIAEQKRIEAEKKKAEEEAKKKAEASAQAFKDYCRTLDDVTILAAIIYCEANVEPYEGKVAVGAVVLNRVASSRFPNNIVDVLFQNSQFSPVGSGSFKKCLMNNKMNDACYKAAREALAGADPSGGCLFFRMVNHGRDGLLIGNHVFY